MRRLKYPITVPVVKNQVCTIELEIPAGTACEIIAYKTDTHTIKCEHNGFKVTTDVPIENLYE